jgi:adenylate kinase
LKQAVDLDTMMVDKSGIDAVIYFDVNEDDIVARLTSRRTCRGCGLNYNTISDPPPADAKCRVCGGEIYQRDDDQEATVRNRLLVYNEKTAPLVVYYKNQQKLHAIDGSRAVEKVRQDIIDFYQKLAM